MIKEIPLFDIFEPRNGSSKLTNAYCKNHPGSYHVYSGNTDGFYAEIDSYEYDGDYLTWAKDGLAGYIWFHRNEQFSITGHRCILLQKDPENAIYLPYVKYVLEPLFRNLIKGRIGDKGANEYSTLSPTMLRKANIAIPIPVNSDGTYDIQEQKRLAGQYEFVDMQKGKIQDYIDDIMVLTPQINASNVNYEQIDQILNFDIPTNNSKLTKPFVRNHPGNIPVYGASKNGDIPSYGYIADNVEGVKYFQDCLTYNMDGLAGRLFFRRGRFVPSEKVVPLVLYESLTDKIDLDYIRYIAEPLFRANIKGRIGDNGKNEYSKLYRTMIRGLKIPIPIRFDGTYDIEMQRDISTKYKRIEALKRELKEKAEKITNTTVLIE